MNNHGYDQEGSNSLATRDDFIVALFVVVFDTKRGNEIEWLVPDDVDLSGVEFKALVSGSHTIEQDFVYFRHQQYYGLSCYAQKEVESLTERGARMKSVGIICQQYLFLHDHHEFLETQVRKQLDFQHNYSELIAYYIKYHNCPYPNNTCFATTNLVHNAPKQNFTHPPGCFAQLVKYFGVNIFILWKFVLLKKRILLYDPPPVGSQCHRVYCLSLMGGGHHEFRLPHNGGTHPLFYISLHSINSLGSLDAFIACTTESIFESKPNAYDLYGNRKKLVCTKPHLKHIMRVNSADRKRFKRLNKFNTGELHCGSDNIDDEELYNRFFIKENKRIFKTLHSVSLQCNNNLTPAHAREMGLDSSSDRSFIGELADVHGLSVHVYEKSCCNATH